MSTVPSPDQLLWRPDSPAWSLPEMRLALAHRDLRIVYRLLQRYGASQRQIAAKAEQSQSEISEILSGRRVTSYDVLTRIAEGFGVPRGHLGLAYDETTLRLLEEVPAVAHVCRK